MYLFSLTLKIKNNIQGASLEDCLVGNRHLDQDATGWFE